MTDSESLTAGSSWMAGGQGVWGNPNTSNAAAENQRLNMQNYPNAANNPSGWGSNTSQPENFSAQQPGAQEKGADESGSMAAANQMLWSRGLSLGTAVQKPQPQVNQNSAWNISDGKDGASTKNGNSEQWGDNRWGAAGNPQSGAPNQNESSANNGWGNEPSPSPGPSGMWGQSEPNNKPNTSSWGPITSQSNNTQWGDSENAKTQTQPSSWAQAAGKGLPPTPPTSNGNSNTAAPKAKARSDIDDKISEAVNANQGWGSRPVRQDSSWDAEVSPRSRRREIEKANSNVWNQPVNTGTHIWESAKQAQQGSNFSESKSEWESEDSNTWTGPPNPNSASNTWVGADKNSSQRGGNPNGNNSWENNQNASNNTNTWNGPPQPPRDSSSSWDGHSGRSSGSYDNGPSRNSGTWGDGQKGGNGSGNGGNNGGSGSISTWEDPRAAQQSSTWDRNGTAVWGDPSSGKSSQWNEKGGNSGPPGPNQGGNNGGVWNEQGIKSDQNFSSKIPSGWSDNGAPYRGNDPSRGSGWGDSGAQPKPGTNWGEMPADVTPQGWGEPSQSSSPVPRKGMDGTQFWGDPSQGKSQGGSGTWNANSPTTPRPRPDDGTNIPMWGDKPPSNKPDGGWGDSQAGGNSEMWSNMSQPKNGNWNDGANQWNNGAKPKSSSSSWGSVDNWNKPDTWSEEISTWGDEDTFSNQDITWSSAKDFKKPMKIPIKGANNFGSNMYKGQPPQMRIKLLQQLTDMGFKKEDAQNALISNNMNLDSAIADLIAGANADRNDIKVRSQHDMLDDENAGDKMPPVSSMQNNTQPIAQGQLPNPNAAMKHGGTSLPNPSSLGSMTNPSINPSLQQKIIQQHPVLGQPPIRGPMPAQSVQLVQAHMVQQIRMAIQAGILNPQILNQQFSPQMFAILQQMLSLHPMLQQLTKQQQTLLKAPSPSTREQLAKLNAMIQNIRQQLTQQQQALSQAEQQFKQQQQQQKDQSSTNLPQEFGNLTVKDQQQPQSRLNQWKLPSPDKEGDANSESKVVGSKPSSAPSSQSQSKFEFTRSISLGGDSTWSNLPTSGLSDWPTSSSLTPASSSSAASNSATDTATTDTITKTSAESSDTKGDSILPSESPNALTSEDSTSNAPLTSGAPTYSFNDMIPEFVPGKPWQGVANKNIEDDPHITPGSISRPLSVNTIKDEYLNTLTNKFNNFTGDITNPTWSSGGGQGGRQAKWSNAPPTMTSDLWGAPGQGQRSSRPPPGLQQSKQQSIWGGGSQSQHQQPPSSAIHRSISWGGDKSAFSTVGPSNYDSRGGISSILLLKNINSLNESTVRTLVMQQGTITMFQPNHSTGQVLVRFSTKEEAARAQRLLNGNQIDNTVIYADFFPEDFSRMVDQPQMPVGGGGPWSQGQGQGQQSQMPPQQFNRGGNSQQWNGYQSQQTNAYQNQGGGSYQSQMWGGGLWGGGGLGGLSGDLLGGESF